MNENFRVKIQLTDSVGAALEVANVSVDIVLYFKERVRYRFCAGRTDMRGQLLVTFDQLEKKRLENQRFSLMDYNMKLQECDSHASFIVPPLNELQQRQAAAEKWFADSMPNEIDGTNNGNLVCEKLDVDSDIVGEKAFLICHSEP